MLRILRILAGLTKYKLSLAVVFSAVTGYFLAGGIPDFHIFFLVAGVFLLSSGSATLNQYTERETDSLMERTHNRPIPAKEISASGALVVAVVLIISGCTLLFFNGVIPMLTGIACMLMYNFVYTSLKKRTILSIIPGALVGALPPLIGFSSAGGSLTHKMIIAFSLFMFLWQIPHFWLILMKYGREYKAAGLSTITTFLSDGQVRYLVFFWVLFSSLFITFFFIFAVTLGRYFFMLPLILNSIFICFFYRLLFLVKDDRDSKLAFMLINSFSLVVMLAFIAVSFLKGA
jgi:heme o synthase